MTQDDIMLMAQKAGPLTQGPFTEWCKRFANLVAAHKAEVITAEAYRCGVLAGAEAEREECAKVAEQFEPDEKTSYVMYASKAIRARSQA